MDVIDHDASPEDARRASKSGKKTVLDVPPEAIEKEHKALQQEHGPGDHEANAVKRVAAKMIRQSSAIGGRIIGKENSSISPEEKERRRKERLERDAWCRRERKYRDSSPDGRGEPTEWLEGDKVRGDGSGVFSFLVHRSSAPYLLRSSSSTPTVGRTSASSPRKSDANRQRSTSPLSTRWDITRKRWKPSSLAWLARSRTAASAVSDGKRRNPKPPLPRNVPPRLHLAALPNRQNDKAPLPKRRKQTGILLRPRSTGRDSRWTGPNASNLCLRRRKRRHGNRKPRRAELPRPVGARPSGRGALPCKLCEVCSDLVPTRRPSRLERRQLSPRQTTTVRPTRIRTATLRSVSRLRPDRTEKARRPVTVGRCQS